MGLVDLVEVLANKFIKAGEPTPSVPTSVRQVEYPNLMRRARKKSKR